jgi:hypothetical protein
MDIITGRTPVTTIEASVDMRLHYATRPRRRVDQIVERSVDDSIVVYDLRHQRAHVLNQTAAVIWQHCTGDLGISDIAEQVVQQFPASLDLVERDVAEILVAFANEKLLST